MKVQNKIKISIGAVVAAIIAVYTYFLSLYSGEYLNSTAYISQTGIILLFTLLAISVIKFVLNRNKNVAVLLTASLIISGLFLISYATGKTLRYNAEGFVLAMWPLMSHAVAKHINIGKAIGHKPFIFDFIFYNVITVGLIIIFEEIIFKYKYFSADVIAEMYMYIISVISFMLYNKKIKKINLDKWDIVCIIITICVITFSWVSVQERIVSIIESLNHSRTAVDADGDFINWLSHRAAMIKVFFSGDYSMVNSHRFQPMINGCSLAWLSSSGGLLGSILILLLSALEVFLMVNTEQITTNITSSVDALKQYKDLLDSGVITQEEFDEKKKQLLGL